MKGRKRQNDAKKPDVKKGGKQGNKQNNKQGKKEEKKGAREKDSRQDKLLEGGETHRIQQVKDRMTEQIYATKKDLRPKLLGMESKEAVDARKKLAELPIDLSKRIEGRSIPMFDNIGEEVDFIKRPKWTYDMTKEELDANEKRQFTDWIMAIIDNYPNEINYFESNIETWRQLWRVVERSSIVIMIIDVRFGNVQFNSRACEWVKSLGKGFGVILNKTDLVDKDVVEKW